MHAWLEFQFSLKSLRAHSRLPGRLYLCKCMCVNACIWWPLGFISCLAATINYSANDYCGFMKKARRPASDNFGFPRSIRRSIKDYCGFMKNARWRLLRLREDMFGDPAGDYFDPVATLGNPPATTSTTCGASTTTLSTASVY